LNTLQISLIKLYFYNLCFKIQSWAFTQGYHVHTHSRLAWKASPSEISGRHSSSFQELKGEVLPEGHRNGDSEQKQGKEQMQEIWK
jgi:hypothetical protein